MVIHQGASKPLHTYESGLDDESEQGPGDHLEAQLEWRAREDRAALFQAGSHHFAKGAQQAELKRGRKKGMGQDPESVTVHVGRLPRAAYSGRSRTPKT